MAPGVYREQVTVSRSRLSIVGQSPVRGAMTITWSVPNAAVLNVTGDDFILANATVYNDANHFSIERPFSKPNEMRRKLIASIASTST